jgi:hypothetical protein
MGRPEIWGTYIYYLRAHLPADGWDLMEFGRVH